MTYVETGLGDHFLKFREKVARVTISFIPVYKSKEEPPDLPSFFFSPG